MIETMNSDSETIISFFFFLNKLAEMEFMYIYERVLRDIFVKKKEIEFCRDVDGL